MDKSPLDEHIKNYESLIKSLTQQIETLEKKREIYRGNKQRLEESRERHANS